MAAFAGSSLMLSGSLSLRTVEASFRSSRLRFNSVSFNALRMGVAVAEFDFFADDSSFSSSKRLLRDRLCRFCSDSSRMGDKVRLSVVRVSFVGVLNRFSCASRAAA